MPTEQKNKSAYQRAMDELCNGLQEKDALIAKLENRIGELEHTISAETWHDLTKTLADQMKVEYFIEHFENISQADLEKIIKR
jgi:hypothetical protein